MEKQSDVLLVIRADLSSQIDQLQEHCRAMTLPALHEAIDAIRATAARHQLLAVEGVARAFERSIVRDRQGTAFGLYFDQLKLATDCDRAGDASVRDSMLAAISVRMAG